MIKDHWVDILGSSSTKENIILWTRGEPYLYCEHLFENRWRVINGGWDLILNGLSGRVVETGYEMIFDRFTHAPKGKDYNEILEKAKDS